MVSTATATSTYFRSLEVSIITGVTLRQLQWWDEQDFIHPIHRAHTRYYSSWQLAKIAVVHSLRTVLGLQTLRAINFDPIIAWIQTAKPSDWFGLSEDLCWLTSSNDILSEQSNGKAVIVRSVESFTTTMAAINDRRRAA